MFVSLLACLHGIRHLSADIMLKLNLIESFFSQNSSITPLHYSLHVAYS